MYIKQKLKSKLSERQFLAMDNICVTHEKRQRTLAILKMGHGLETPWYIAPVIKKNQR